jgi:hypothetical protein
VIASGSISVSGSERLRGAVFCVSSIIDYEIADARLPVIACAARFP